MERKVRKATRKIPKTVDAVEFDRYIHKVLQQVHPDQGMSHSSMDTVNNMVRFLLRKVITCIMRTKVKATVTSRDVQLAVRMVLPGELAKHAVSEGTKAVTKFNSNLPATVKGQKNKAHRREFYAGLQFSVSRVENVMRTMGLSRIGVGASVYLAAVCEYITAEILELSGNAAKDNKRSRIARKYVMAAIGNDSELKCFFDSAILGGGVIPHIEEFILRKKK